MTRFSFILFFLSFQFACSQWEPCNNGLTGVGVNTIVVNKNKIFAGTAGGGFFISSDDGNNWIPNNDGLLDTTVVSIGFSGNNIFAGTRNAGMFLSKDEGGIWTEKNNGFSLNSVWSIAVDGENIYTGTRDSGIFLSTDMGDSWSQINNHLIYIRSLLAVGGEVFAGTYNSGMYVSADQGTSWMERNNGLDDIDVRCLGMKDNNIFAGTSALGIFHTTDQGLNWHNETIGMDRYGSVWAIVFAGDNIFLGSYDRGVFLSTDNGNNWLEKNAGFSDTSVTLLAVNDKYIFAGTGNGIYRAKLSEIITEINYDNSLYDNLIKISDTPEYLQFYSKNNYTIKVFDMLGNQIINHNNPTEIVKSSLQSGIYICSVTSLYNIQIFKFLVIE